MIQSNVNLQPHNTFGLESIAKNFATFGTIDELKALLLHNQTAQHELLVLGGGSNILLTQDFDGLVLKNDLKGIEMIGEDGNDRLVKASAGENWHDFVLYAIEHNLGGIENLSLIPGSVGASPMQNIGAYGVEIKDVFHELEALNIETLAIEKFDSKMCSFGYRESVFKRTLKGKYVILSMTLRLSKDHQLNTSYGAIENQLAEMNIDNPTIKNVSDAVITIRQSKLPDPKKIGNSGSFFKNPVIGKAQFDALKAKFPTIANYPIDENHIKLAAGWLIDNAGWKGKRIDNYGVHKNQALVLVNYGGAKGRDIYNLSEAILESISATYGVDLEREVNII
ncbi:MAG: UDP-N-acetylmuramate dehydrogenase [Crocinitomix sp.]|nr:UDP-N-acetylmuramate dehydrogenase [Crocinitomix sp.]